MKKMMLIVASLLVLSLLIIACKTGATKAGEAQKAAIPLPQIGTAFSCSLKKNCDSILALYAKVDSLESRITALEGDITGLKSGYIDLKDETKLARSEVYMACLTQQTGCGIISPWGGCPRGTTVSSCTDTTHVLCTGSQEFGDVTIDCTAGGGNNVCTGEAPAAKCTGAGNTG